MSMTPQQDERHRDSGRRQILINGRPVMAAKAKLRADELLAHFPATHQIVFRATPGVTPRAGLTVEFDGDRFTVTALGDPHAGDELMRRKFVKLICLPLVSPPA